MPHYGNYDHFRYFKIILPAVRLIFHIMSYSVLPFTSILAGCSSVPCPKLNFLTICTVSVLEDLLGIFRMPQLEEQRAALGRSIKACSLDDPPLVAKSLFILVQWCLPAVKSWTGFFALYNTCVLLPRWLHLYSPSGGGCLLLWNGVTTSQLPIEYDFGMHYPPKHP